MRRNAIFHFHDDLKVVVNLFMEYVLDIRINGFHLHAGHHEQDLINEVDSPVIYHAAAIFFIDMPFMHIPVSRVKF